MACGKEGAGRVKDQKGQSFYSISFPQPHPQVASGSPRLAPVPDPFTPSLQSEYSPGPGSSRQPRSRGFLEVGREIRTPESREDLPPSDYIKM